MSATTSKLMFSSSSTDGPVKQQRRNRSKNGPVTVIQGPRREAPAKPQLSRATAEALYRSGGRMPSMDRLR